MYRPIAAACAVLALAACATPTVYAPANPNPNATGAARVGFSEYKIENNRYRVTFQGGSGAPQQLVADYALFRAAEITLRDGYDWFQVIDRFGGASGYAGNGPRISVGAGTSSGSGRYGGYYGGGSGIGIGVGTSFPLGGGNGHAYAHTIEIVEGRGVKPDSPDVYDARGVAAALAPRSHASGY
jgi:hypothetical protein